MNSLRIPGRTTRRTFPSRPRRLIGTAAFFISVLISSVTFGQPSEDVAPINLVTSQAAICLEIPQLEATWNQVRQSQLLTRLKQFPLKG